MHPLPELDRNPAHHLPGRPMTVGDHTHRFFDTLERMVVDGGEALGITGGNLRFAFYDGTCVTLVTSGPAVGIYYEAIEVPVHFSMKCEEWFINNLLDPELSNEPDYDMNEAAMLAGLELEGDLAIYERFCRFAKKTTSLDLRVGPGRSGTTATKRRARRTRRP